MCFSIQCNRKIQTNHLANSIHYKWADSIKALLLSLEGAAQTEEGNCSISCFTFKLLCLPYYPTSFQPYFLILIHSYPFCAACFSRVCVSKEKQKYCLVVLPNEKGSVYRRPFSYAGKTSNSRVEGTLKDRAGHRNLKSWANYWSQNTALFPHQQINWCQVAIIQTWGTKK